MSTRFIKVFRDLKLEFGKNLMLALAIALGVFGIGATLGTRSVLMREMASNYTGTSPATATIETEQPITAGLLDSIRTLKGVKVAERHATISAQIKSGDRWVHLLLFVIDDFKNKQTNKIRFISGSNDPAIGSILIERSSYVMMRSGEDDSVTIKTSKGQPASIKIAGTVHDAGLAPAWQEQAVYGYVSISTLKLLGETQGFDQLRLIADDPEPVAEFVEANGYKVHEIQIPPKGRHPHQSQMNTVLTIFMVFSFLLLLLGSVLVATSIATMMIKQVRQIGVMKTIGASPLQIMTMYFTMMIAVCTLSLIIAVPLGRMAANAFTMEVSKLVNVEITDSVIPISVLIIQVLCGILVPMILSAVPLIRGSRISVRAALANFGVNANPSQWQSRLFANSETLKLSVRNIFRQRSRLALTLALLTIGGAIFMTALNVSDAWYANLGRISKQRQYDLEVRFDQRILVDSLMMQVRLIEGVKDVEAWDYSTTSFSIDGKFETTQTYPDKGHGSFILLAVPGKTKMISPDMVEGTWLRDEYTDGVVLNQMARSSRPYLKIGDAIKLSVNDSTSTWKIIGFSEDVGSGAVVYVPKPASSDGRSKTIRVSYHDRSRENANVINSKIEKLFEQEKINVSSMIPVWLLHNAIAGHMKVIINALMSMAILMAFVGALGLMSTMSMSVMERTREIGVMRAIGGTPNKVKLVIALEGLTVGLISFVLAAMLGVVFSYYFGKFIGSMAFKTPLSLSISAMGLGLWALIILVGSYLATYFPARRAGRITTREALAYE
jgi:putative ABC transport system permease protein